MTAPRNGIKVRMYRVNGLGDCFLLAMRARDGAARYLMIDCGVFMGTEGGDDRMRLIANDIVRATGGQVDVMVVTHEHWDHLSGFYYARQIFEDRLEVQQLWLGWTEDPLDPLAEALRQRKKFLISSLHMAIGQMQAFDDTRAEDLQDLAAFNGPALATDGNDTGSILNMVRAMAEQTRYLTPGEAPLGMEGVDGVRIYVLGPPRDTRLLKKSDPSKGDVYQAAFSFDESIAFSLAALAGGRPTSELSEEETDRVERSMPFDKTEMIPIADALDIDDREYSKFFRSYLRGGKWQRIDEDWLGGAENLALKLDSDTNNTSVVLAIELESNGKVLLFPGDAQVGNWRSWHTLEWNAASSSGGANGRKINAADLLRRTVLYKVGHHGSHNATLRGQGLELMESADLVALLPVDEDQARKKRWEMPFPPLYERLIEKTRGRILRMDDGVPNRPAGITDKEWRRFKRRVEQTDLWLEIVIG
jgi:hypothetical protein